MVSSHKIQVNKDHYNWDYESVGRWKSYYYQIDNILKNLDPNEDKVLEIGIGNHFIEDKLKRLNVNITTADFDRSLNPDYVADITQLPFSDNSFNIVCAFEVLEHIPFEEIGASLNEMKRVSNNIILFTVPFITFNLYIGFKLLPYIGYKDIELKMPLFFKKHQFDGQHYWEIGKREYPLQRIKDEISRNNLKIKYTWKVKRINQIGFCISKK